MKTYAEVAEVLRKSIKSRNLSQARLKNQAGISQRTLTNVLSGEEDFKLSTLFTLADRLGLELVLVPKLAARAVAAGPAVTKPIVQSRVAAALEGVLGKRN